MHRLSCVFDCIFSLTVFRTASRLVMSTTTASMMRGIVALWASSAFQLFILLHQLFYIRCSSLNLLSHHHRIESRCRCKIHQVTKALLVGAQWFEKRSTLRSSHRWCQIDEAEFWPRHYASCSLVPIIKKRKAREGSASVRPVKNTPMLKSDYKFSKEVSYNSLPMFLCLLTSILFPFL